MPDSRSLPGVTVVIPTRDRAAFLAAAIDSVLRVQVAVSNVARVQVIVVDDRSTDGTPGVALSRGVSMVPNQGSGVSAARNTGALAASTEYVAFLDDDDIWLEGHVVGHLAVLESRPEVALVFAQGILTDAQLNPVFPAAPGGPLPDGEAFIWALTQCIQVNTMIVRRSVMLELGGFDLALPSSQDWDFELRLASKYDCVGLEIPVALFRQAEANEKGYQGWCDIRDMTLDVVRRGSRLPARVEVPPWKRLTLTFEIRGWFAARFLFAAQDYLKSGDPREAARCLWEGLKTSPPHAILRMPDYWRTSARVFVVGLTRRTVA